MSDITAQAFRKAAECAARCEHHSMQKLLLAAAEQREQLDAAKQRLLKAWAECEATAFRLDAAQQRLAAIDKLVEEYRLGMEHGGGVIRKASIPQLLAAFEVNLFAAQQQIAALTLRCEVAESNFNAQSLTVTALTAERDEAASKITAIREWHRSVGGFACSHIAFVGSWEQLAKILVGVK